MAVIKFGNSILGQGGADGQDGTGGLDGLGWTGGSYNAGTGVVTFTSDDALGFVTGDLRGATGATGAATADVKLGFLHFNNYNDKFIVDVAAQTITLTSYTTSILRSDDLKLQTPITTQVLDFSSFLTINTIIYLIWDKTAQTFSVTSTVSTFTNSADKYFITSFRRYTGQTDVELSFNKHAFKVKGSSDKYIQKWTILGDSHTFGGGTWINIVDRNFGNINSILNLGWNGSTIADVLSNSFYDRRISITSDTDLLTIFGGTNDYENTAAIGTIQPIGGTFTITTLMGSLQTIIEYAFTVNPLMKINIITPHYHYDANTNGNQYDVSAYVDSIKAVAALYSIPVLDLQKVLGINELTYTSFMNTGETKPIHLNTLGREKAGHAIGEFIKANN
jgi:hypothetical protein